MQVLGYVRVSSPSQAESGAGIDAQRAAIEAECERRGWRLAEIVEDAGFSARNLNRPGIQKVLERLDRGDADGLIASKLDRLSRSMLDFTALMDRAQRQGWALVALDCAVDTTTPAGEAMANVLATFSQFERRLIGQRTREALAARKAAGVRLGRPRELPVETAERIRRDRSEGRSLAAIADRLNDEGVPTAHGGARWWPQTIRSILAQSRTAQEPVSRRRGPPQRQPRRRRLCA